jgi:cardiolipin synthase
MVHGSWIAGKAAWTREVHDMRTPIVLAVFAITAACATVQDVDKSFLPQSTTQIMGARGPLTAQQSKALLDKIATEAGEAGVLRRHLTIEEAVAESSLVAGNHTKLLADGTDTFPAMFTAIKNAKEHVNLEYYIFEDVESGGELLGDLLIAKRNEGVAVNIIYDSYGSDSTAADFLNRLRAAGINLVEFNPINPLDARVGYSLNNRDHRKILVVDGAKAIVGGINLSTTYQSSSLGKSGAAKDKPDQRWRDTDLEIDGPVVAQLQTLFLDHWSQQKGPPLESGRFYPTVPAKGTEVVRIIGSTPDHSIPRYYVTLLSAIRNAEKSIWLSAAYFVPTDQEKEDLIAAARRGVDVRLLLPGDSDSQMAMAVGHSHYSALLESGVKIYETQNLVLHSKAAVIDGVWTVVGSSNFDRRSVLFNDEVDALVLGSATAQELQKMLADDIQNARPIDIASWKGRPIAQRFKEIYARIWQDWL